MSQKDLAIKTVLGIGDSLCKDPVVEMNLASSVNSKEASVPGAEREQVSGREEMRFEIPPPCRALKEVELL